MLLSIKVGAVAFAEIPRHSVIKTLQFKQNEYPVTLRLIHWILPSISAINGESGLTERSGSAKILNP
jgi:hypothetical protein